MVMKRPLQPVSEYRNHEEYPAMEDAGVSRRGFLGKVAAASAVVAGAVVLPTEARAGRGAPDNRQKVSLHVGRYQRVGKSHMSVKRIVLFTGDKKLAKWLKRHSNRSGITQAMSPVLRKAKDGVLLDGKKLYRLERQLGAELIRHYRKKTGKTARQPDLMLVVGRYSRPRMMGSPVRPHFKPRIRP
jgi:hypothetical protein